AVTEPVVGVMDRMNVNLTCFITNDQKTEVQKVQATWKKGANYPEVNIVTVWDKDAQRGNTTLQLKQVRQKDMERYVCIVKSRESFYYKQIKLRVVPGKLRKDTPSQESVEVKPPWTVQGTASAISPAASGKLPAKRGVVPHDDTKCQAVLSLFSHNPGVLRHRESIFNNTNYEERCQLSKAYQQVQAGTWRTLRYCCVHWKAPIADSCPFVPTQGRQFLDFMVSLSPEISRLVIL
ncbi:hypothetical protein HGM15179_018653, partial [Zosterops borbonicus]